MGGREGVGDCSGGVTSVVCVFRRSRSEAVHNDGR